MNTIFLQTLPLILHIQNNFPDYLSLSGSDQQDVLSAAVQRAVDNPSNNLAIAANPCITSCQNQYYIAAGTCALLVETEVGAVICFISACAGLSACKYGCSA